MKKVYESPKIVCDFTDDIITTSVETERIPFEAKNNNAPYQLSFVITPVEDLYDFN